ncbi:MAG TPA: ATP-binding protein [Rickettsiales bacterium]|nr:ATP-binding protein [Rickettsiales bacterium]
MSTSHQDTLQQEHDKFHAMLLTSVSHDLKTPIACIIGSLDIYQQLKGTLSEERKDILIATAINEARRLDNFITNILDMAKLESGIIFQYENIDIAQLVRQCVHQMESVLSQHPVQLELPRQLMGQVNELWISRVLALLLSNAALYTPADTNILVSVTSDNIACWITIRDYGPGISKKMATTIFQKHHRTMLKDTKVAGTGLGLPICKAIAEKHGGAIRCETPDSGDGTIFTITLPLHHKRIKK